MKTNEKPNQKLSLLWQFLRGSKRFFLASILAAAVTALADMLQPQIIRATVDCAIGGQEGDFPAYIMALVERLGGFGYLEYPQYQFEVHKGYCTRIHIRAVEEFGPCPIHRLTFEPIKSILNPPEKIQPELF